MKCLHRKGQLIANIVTTSKALVTTSDALVPSSFLLVKEQGFIVFHLLVPHSSC